MPTFEIASNPSIRLSEIRGRRFQISDINDYYYMPSEVLNKLNCSIFNVLHWGSLKSGERNVYSVQFGCSTKFKKLSLSMQRVAIAEENRAILRALSEGVHV